MSETIIVVILNLMPIRKTVFAKDEVYHIFNRGVARHPIFLSNNTYIRFLNLVGYYRFGNTPVSFSKFLKLPLEIRNQVFEALEKEANIQVEILAFCLMSNHFHLLLRQLQEGGIISFMSNIQNGYVKYFNTKEERVGPLFQSAFKAVRMEDNEQLLHVSRYIHLNPSTEYIVEVEDLANYHWSSLPIYLNKKAQRPVDINTKFVLDFFKNTNAYREFVFNQAEYQRELEQIKHLTLE